MLSIPSFREIAQLNKKQEINLQFFSVSQSTRPKRSKSLSFIPFLQERDKLGKLIIPQVSHTARSMNSNLPLIESKLYSQECKEEEIKDDKMMKVVNSFFKKIDMETKELKRSKFIEKKLMLIAERDPKINRYSSAVNYMDYDLSEALDKIKFKAKTENENYEIKNLSRLKLKQKMTINEEKTNPQSFNDSLNNKRSNSMIEKINKTHQYHELSPEKNTLKLEEPNKKSESVIHTLKVKLNPEQPDYKRFKHEQEMLLKVFPDYEDGHKKFKDKMKESRKIAMKIKEELQIG